MRWNDIQHVGRRTDRPTDTSARYRIRTHYVRSGDGGAYSYVRSYVLEYERLFGLSRSWRPCAVLSSLSFGAKFATPSGVHSTPGTSRRGAAEMSSPLRGTVEVCDSCTSSMSSMCSHTRTSRLLRGMSASVLCARTQNARTAILLRNRRERRRRRDASEGVSGD